ncbi:MAG: hypothetical protein EPN61_12025 [Burkholderiaceae bacterium]|nr:MAG: hypothetical protein EPN61_12025 [Burkholderiaceae bacterium]
MPIFAKLFGAFGVGLVALLSQFMAARVAVKLAAYLTWMAIVVSMVTTTAFCVGNLMDMVAAFISGGGAGAAGHYLAMGIGMFIPSNAGAVMGCIASVWLITSVYKLQKTGVTVFGS